MAQILMLCHDQHLDRRVIAQAKVLIDRGHVVRLLALALDQTTTVETTPEGIEVTRIGLSHVIPENVTYLGYMARQHRLNDIFNVFANRHPKALGLFQRCFSLASRINWQTYRALLLLRYHSLRMHDPLPFRRAFVSHGENLRSDIVQVHDLPALEAGSALAREWQVPLVYDAHELYPEQRSFSKRQRGICATAEKEHIQHAELVFAVNESIAEEMAKRYSIPKPQVMTNAIDPHESFDLHARYDLLREKLGLAPNRRILLLQGGFAPYRNLNELVIAMKYVQSTDVALVMMGFGDYGQTLQETAYRLGLMGSRVYFLPAVPQSELLQHTASADMGIIPYPHVDLNSYYCTPNKLFEFIQAGLPIIANDSPELRRFVANENFGFIHAMNSSQQIAQAIDFAFGQLPVADWREQLRAKRQAFAWSVESGRYLAAMENTLGKKAQVIADSHGAAA
jgi:glycosyltransferase involved in cell wall biosynthesis